MAAYIRHGLFTTVTQFSTKNFVRYAGKRPNPNLDKKIPPKIEATAKSLAAKGFLRSQKPYQPPTDVSNKLTTIFEAILGPTETKLNDMSKKFLLLNACQKEFNHSVPNSLLHTIETIDDVLVYYQTAIGTTVPLDMMRHIDLPENVHVQFEYHRFHPDTDTKFNGVTAFPGSSTLVTGLKSRKKYRGFETKSPWNDV